MKDLNLSDVLAQNLRHQEVPKFSVEDFPKIETDSRILKPGQWFLALKGEKFDGHQFISQAIENGAKGIICSEEVTNASLPTMLVKDTEKAFQSLSEAYIDSFANLRKVGITGSVGKTTAKNFLETICQHEGETIATPKSFNNEIGVPKTSQLINDKTEYAIFELAARHVGDIRLLTDIVHPHVRVCLNVGVAHLGEFGSVENILRTKTEIFGNAQDDDILICPSSDERIVSIGKTCKQTLLTFGDQKDDAVQTLASASTGHKMKVRYRVASKEYDVVFPYWHDGFRFNGGAMLAVAHALNLDIEQACASLSKIKQQRGRFFVTEWHDRKFLVNDAYNASPDSLCSGLMSLQRSFNSESKTLILGDMLELGKESVELHRKVGETTSKIQNVVRLWTVGPHAKYYEGSNLSEDIEIKNFEDVNELSSYVDSHLEEIKGSRVIYLKSSLGTGLLKFGEELEKRLLS